MRVISCLISLALGLCFDCFSLRYLFSRRSCLNYRLFFSLD